MVLILADEDETALNDLVTEAMKSDMCGVKLAKIIQQWEWDGELVYICIKGADISPQFQLQKKFEVGIRAHQDIWSVKNQGCTLIYHYFFFFLTKESSLRLYQLILVRR